MIFLGDDCVEIFQKLLEKCFFSVVVRILMGCFGILVLFKYVLILVYCLYNGSYYVEGYKSLKVGFLLRNGIIEW